MRIDQRDAAALTFDPHKVSMACEVGEGIETLAAHSADRTKPERFGKVLRGRRTAQNKFVLIDGPAERTRHDYPAALKSPKSLTSLIPSRSNEGYGTSSSDSLRPSRKAVTSSHSTCIETITGFSWMPHRSGQSDA